MTEELGPLRQAMSDLAEHGGRTDLYERTLQRSRQQQRRVAVAGSAAVAVAVLAIGGGVAFVAADRPNPSTPIATGQPAPSATPAPTPTVTPSSPAPSSANPSSTAPSRTAPSSRSKPPSSTPTSDRPRYPDCPSPRTLERLADLPEDWSFPAPGVNCWRTWATAKPEGPNRGDGIFLFRYTSGGGWRYHSQGSAYACADLGITSGKPPFRHF